MDVLIVDDSRAMRRIERQVLSRLGGLEVHEAEDGVSAIYQLKALDFQVDLILVDWMMPRMDGITFVKMMKTSPNLSKIPILMVTSCSDEHMMGRAWETGVNGYLLKPFTKELFLQAILALGPTGADELPEVVADVKKAENTTFLDELPVEMRRRLLDMSIVIDYDEGEEILRAKSPSEYFYFVVTGEVLEQQPAVGCRGALVRKYVPGECFAVIELMAGDLLNSSFVASQETTVGRLPHPAFEAMLLKYPEIGITVSRLLASKARQLDMKSDEGEPNLAGQLEILDLPALIQAISLRQKTCVIELPDLQSEISFSCGQIVSVHRRGQEGREAFFQLMGESPKNFRLAVKSVDQKRNIHESTTGLLLECMRRTDETPRNVVL